MKRRGEGGEGEEKEKEKEKKRERYGLYRVSNCKILTSINVLARQAGRQRRQITHPS
jgi:hypothetical protein